eukprot:CAMPEP_0206140092 /NCGR_PEP_ID=MMETSP1473-20131121/8300_1 /ASSEMBLY_ACC=CAM_ASM_001109 /TAXON_ID=1461547 /ORGANISM="Stichococcus sp, Strain RCC1054" /LENGTH=146 /DNA_ID=CAMNT_0053534103 /DNA_START=687 /DNA_END=1127 /DNA_ORIENTATION=+
MQDARYVFGADITTSTTLASATCRPAAAFAMIQGARCYRAADVNNPPLWALPHVAPPPPRPHLAGCKVLPCCRRTAYVAQACAACRPAAAQASRSTIHLGLSFGIASASAASRSARLAAVLSTSDSNRLSPPLFVALPPFANSASV